MLPATTPTTPALPVPGPCPACQGTSFEVTFQMFVSVTVTDGQVVSADGGPGEVHDFMTSASCTACQAGLSTDDGLRGSYLADENGDEFDDEFDGPDDVLAAFRAVVDTVCDLATNAVVRLDPDATAAALGQYATLRADAGL